MRDNRASARRLDDEEVENSEEQIAFALRQPCGSPGRGIEPLSEWPDHGLQRPSLNDGPRNGASFRASGMRRGSSQVIATRLARGNSGGKGQECCRDVSCDSQLARRAAPLCATASDPWCGCSVAVEATEEILESVALPHERLHIERHLFDVHRRRRMPHATY